MNKAVISIGTNSTRVLIADISGDRGEPVEQRSIGTRLGEGLKQSGHIGEGPMRRTLDAISQYMDLLREHRLTPQVIATSAVRRADNAADFGREVQQLTSAELRVVSGDEEAQFSYAGALSGYKDGAGVRFAVADPGGGSTEYAVGTSRTSPSRVVSCEIGAVRLTEAVPELAGDRGGVPDAALKKAEQLAFAATAPLDEFDAAERLLFVGGTATTTIWLLRGSRDMFAYAPLRARDVEATIGRLTGMDLEKRKALPGMNPQRADILPAGLIILRVLLERTHLGSATVSTNDLLMGYLLRS